MPDKISTGTSMIAPSMIRAETMVSGGSSRSATPTKKNEPPHSTDSATSRHHAPASRDEEGDIARLRPNAGAKQRMVPRGHPICDLPKSGITC